MRVVGGKRRPLYGGLGEEGKVVEREEVGEGVGNVTFQDEFEQLPVAELFFCSEAKLEGNAHLNRFPHVLPFDASRVRLRSHRYINASHITLDPPHNNNSNNNNDNSNNNYGNNYSNDINTIHHGNNNKGHIAAQGPFDRESTEAFWGMVWEKEVAVVVMLSCVVEKGVEQACQYWPVDWCARRYGGVTVQVDACNHYSHWVVRRLVLHGRRREEEGGGGLKRGEGRKRGGEKGEGEKEEGEKEEGEEKSVVKQFQFTGWESEDRLLWLLEFWRLVREEGKKEEGGRREKEGEREEEEEVEEEGREREGRGKEGRGKEGAGGGGEEEGEGRSERGAWVVHCSTGVGRTGVFIALDHLLGACEVSKEVGVYGVVQRMRKQRPLMVPSLRTYNLLYALLHQALAVPHQHLFLNRFNTRRLFANVTKVNSSSKTTSLKQQFALCQRLVRCDVNNSNNNNNNNKTSDKHLVRLREPEAPSEICICISLIQHTSLKPVTQSTYEKIFSIVIPPLLDFLLHLLFLHF